MSRCWQKRRGRVEIDYHWMVEGARVCAGWSGIRLVAGTTLQGPTCCVCRIMYLYRTLPIFGENTYISHIGIYYTQLH